MTKERSGGEPEWEPNAGDHASHDNAASNRGVKRYRARRVALELGTGGGQSIPARISGLLERGLWARLLRVLGS